MGSDRRHVRVALSWFAASCRASTRPHRSNGERTPRLAKATAYGSGATSREAPHEQPGSVQRRRRSKNVDVVRGPCEGAAGSKVSRRRATVWNGGERAEEKKVEERNRAFGGRTRFCCESYPSPPNAERAPGSSFGLGRACSVHRAFFSSAPRPARARRAFNPDPSPRALFTRVLDVRTSFKPRPCAPRARPSRRPT